jgi:tetratricopeptide (TPR) repeat protein
MGNGSVIVASFIQDFCPDFRIAHNPLCQWRKPGHAEFFVIIGGEKTLKANEELKKLMQTAVALHREGKLDAAEQLYRKYLAAWPHNAHAWPNLGALLRTRGLYQPSIAAHRKALPNLHLGSRLVEGKSYQAY